MKKIEREFNELVEWNENNKRNNNATGVECVLQYLLDNKQQTWFWAWELIGKTNSKGGYLSHRAPARASDLAIHYPEFVEHRKIGKYKVYRLKVENLSKIIKFLNNEEK
jgi:hypothetical protein